MANKQTPSQPQVPSTESEYLIQVVESLELTPPEIVNHTSTRATAPEDFRTWSEERRYATHWGINE